MVYTMNMGWKCTSEMHQEDKGKRSPYVPLYNPECILHFEGPLRIPNTPSKRKVESERGRMTEWEYRQYLYSRVTHPSTRREYRFPMRAFRVIQSEQEVRVA